MQYEIQIHRDSNGKEFFSIWLSKLNIKSQANIENRISRIKNGNFGDNKYLGDGIYEIRFFFGPGYRVYFGKKNQTIVILICGGDKKTQKKDIEKAKTIWKINYTE